MVSQEYQLRDDWEEHYERIKYAEGPASSSIARALPRTDPSLPPKSGGYWDRELWREHYRWQNDGAASTIRKRSLNETRGRSLYAENPRGRGSTRDAPKEKDKVVSTSHEQVLQGLRRRRMDESSRGIITLAAVGLGVAGYATMRLLHHNNRNVPEMEKGQNPGAKEVEDGQADVSRDGRDQSTTPMSRSRGGFGDEHVIHGVERGQARSIRGSQPSASSHSHLISRRGFSAHASNSSNDLSSNPEEKRRIKHAQSKQLVTTTLAAAAAINAADTVYNSFVESRSRRKAIAQGEISSQEAKSMRKRAMVQDVASLGIAVVNIQGAVGVWKDAKELKSEVRAFHEWKKGEHEA